MSQPTEPFIMPTMMIDSCRMRYDHEPHFFIPDFLEEQDFDEAPDFLCGGYPRKIIDIEEGSWGK